jgi:hypothetical protein
VIPDFLRRAKDVTPPVLEYAFNGATDKMMLGLSWVPPERLTAARPDGST